MDFNYNSIYEALLEMDDNGQIYVRNFSQRTRWNTVCPTITSLDNWFY